MGDELDCSALRVLLIDWQSQNKYNRKEGARK